MLTSKTLLSAFAISCLALPALAQSTTEPQFKITCEEGNWSRNDGENKRFCETRDLTMNAPGGQPLSIDGGANGGIAVHGWSGPNVRIRAKVTSWASTDAEAQSRVKSVTIRTANNTLKADAPGKDEHYSVSYEVFVPRQTALALNTVNGGISLDNMQSDVKFHAVNGGVSLTSLGGQVTGQTVNGGLNITLTGNKWNGKGLDVETTNGGVHWKLPQDYSAQFFTSTNMGDIRSALPVNKSGFMHKEVTANLGKGGAPVKAVTTNGGISVDQGRD
ncbi:hypothetical protein AUC43_16130 [Hymenobacter sedentarius]|uniref:DUF4097 domain-containing protein n=1 Tax=Hymenobacter sedentarius TaxID=1411621 RepID=A0A0U4ASR1_9BACT|nr:DUF4097 family beta strand repeat-containing protein [Hymenobacter sedentarius]ALW86480.1 hypothetical protein AUC43_16130 [Hymenobacter sedentarius]